MQQPVSGALPQSQRFWFSGRAALGCSQGQSSPGSKQRDKPAVLGPGASLSRSDIRSSGTWRLTPGTQSPGSSKQLKFNYFPATKCIKN